MNGLRPGRSALVPGPPQANHAGREAWELLLFCPTCGSGPLDAVFEGRQVNAPCRRCGCCWHVEGRVIRRVDPSTCPGCEFRSLCVAALAERSP